MAPTLYKSTDASAPVLTGSNGSLIALLDAILVNGYGAKAAAGWTIAFQPNANQRVYRNAQSGSGGSGLYLQVDDAGPNATLGARHARCKAWEVCTAYNVGTNGFPTAAAQLQVYKSTTADATARGWVALADNKTLYLFTDVGTQGEINGWSAFMAGDIFSLKTSDPYRFAVIGRDAEPTYVGGYLEASENFQGLAALSAVNAGHFVARSYMGATQLAVAFGKHSGDAAKRGLVPYPNGADQSLMLAQFWVHEDVGAQGVVRGRLRGVWDFLHDPMVRVNDGDTFSGTGPLAGRTFYVLKPLGGITNAIRMLILETSDTWETSA
jgi:hypothetical protein